MFSEKKMASSIPLVVDVAGRGITEVSQIPGGGREVAALTADNNKLVSLKGIHTLSSLIQCSMCSNRLVNIGAVSALTRLVTLNLQNNSLTAIEGLEPLVHLEWLGLAGNSIKVMSGLSGNTKLAHLDLSDNCITELGNISMLRSLKTLLLHGNAVTLLKSIPECFPASLTTLSLAENHVQDLNEVSFLSTLPELSEVSVMGNPCVSLTHHSTLFDYRPYVVYWCPGLSTLDGITISAEEKLRSVSLFHSDHTYPFHLGQHQSLVQYLMTACPLPALQEQMCSHPDQSATFNPLSHTLLTQALTLEDPQQKVDVMQKLRVLQVLEQMISQQEDLLNTRQHSETPLSTISNTTTTGNSTPENTPEKREQLSSHSDKQQHTDTVNGGDLNGSLAGTVVTGDTRDVVSVESEEVMSDVIRPQPSLPFDIVHSSSKCGKDGHQRVRIAWAEGETASDDTTPHGARENESREREEKGEVREEKDGVGERGVQVGDVEGADQDALTAASSTQSLSLQSVTSNVDTLSLLPSATALCSTTAPDVGRGDVTRGNELPGTGCMLSSTTASVTASSNCIEQSLAESILHSEFNQPSTIVTEPLTPPTSISTSSVVSSKSAVAPIVVHTTSMDAPRIICSEKTRGEYLDVPLQTSGAVSVTSPSSQGTVEQTARVRDDEPLFVASDPSLEDTATAEGGVLEVKYSSSVDPPALIGSEGESSLPLPVLPRTDTMESDSQFLPLLGGGIKTSPVREWDLSSLASSLSQAYGIADISARTNLLAALSSRQPPPPARDDSELERESMPDEDATCGAGKGGETAVSVVRERGERKERNEAVEVEKRRSAHEEELVTETHERKEEKLAAERYRKSGNQTSTKQNDGFSFTKTATAANTAHEILPQTSVALKVLPQVASLSQYDAAVTIQARVRGFLCRKSVSAYKTGHRAATIIQATWRGIRSRRCDPIVVGVRRELNRKKMETYVATMYLQLKGCREEMAHQTQILQLQEETIASLIQEVESLHEWKRGTEEKTSAITIQRYWKGYRARKDTKTVSDTQSSQQVESLCCELKQQVQDLERKVASLQDDNIRQRNEKTSQSTGSTFPAPKELSMCKYSADTILLQWTIPDGVCDSSLLGCRVYVNGAEEGMVGPTKSKAYIEGLDTSTTYRISVRAVYDHGESEDSNMLLLASLDPHSEGERSTPTLTGSQNEVVSLPRALQPPAPTQQTPTIVQKSSSLSKSESSLTLGTLSVENSTIELRSMSASQLGTALDQNEDLLVVSKTPFGHTDSSVCKTLPAVKKTGTSIIDFRSTHPVGPQASVRTQPQLTASDDNNNDHEVLLRQEIGHELSERHDQVDQQSHTAHYPIYAMSPTTLDPLSQGKAVLAGKVHNKQKHTTAVSDFTEEEASSLTCEAYQSPQHSKQTQPPLSSSDRNGLKTGNLQAVVASNSHSPTIPLRGEGIVCSARTEKSESATQISDVALRHARTMSPVNQRSPRLAAVFVHTQASASTFSPQHQSSRPFVDSTHTTQLSSLTFQSDPTSAKCPSQQPNKGSAFVGSIQSAEHTDTNALFSGKEQNEEGFVGKAMTGKSMEDKKSVVSCNTNTQVHLQEMHTEGFGHTDSQPPLATTGHLLSHTCQPVIETTQESLNVCQEPFPSLPATVSSATNKEYAEGSTASTKQAHTEGSSD